MSDALEALSIIKQALSGEFGGGTYYEKYLLPSINTIRARIAELEAERAELEETASANWNHCQEVDNYLIELLGEDFPTNSEESAENTKAAIRKLMANNE